MLRKVLQTDTDRGSLLLRLGLAIVIFPHGAQKLLGWFGGFGLEGSLDYFTGTLGIPLLFAWLAVLAEFFGPVALAAGLLTRVSACGIGMVMLVGALFGLLVENPTGAFLPSGTLPAKNPDGSRTEPSGRGYFPGKFNGADVTVKDTKRYADTGGWGYYNFNHHEPKAPTAKLQPKSECAYCHMASAKKDDVWTQFYPLLDN